MNQDLTIDGWVDSDNNKWYCSLADARDTCANPEPTKSCPAGPGSSGGDITTMTDAQMEAAYGGQFSTVYPKTGGVGYDASQLTRTGGSCCAANTKVETLFKRCVCADGYKETTYPITDLTTAKSESDLSCVQCSTLGRFLN